MTRSRPPVRAHDHRRPKTGRARRGEEGDTLVEVLIALVVIGLTATALLGAFATSISASAEHRSLATIDTMLDSFAETATYQIQLQPSPLFASCANSYAFVPAFTPPAGYRVTFTVSYWSNSRFVATCTAGSTAPQLIVATATGPAGTSGSVSFVVTKTAFSGTGSAGQAAPALTSAGAVTVAVGTAFTYTVTTSGSPAPALSASLSPSGALPTGISFVDNGDGSATLSGTAAVALASFTLAVTAANGIGSPATQSLSVNVETPATITSASSYTSPSGTSFRAPITAAGYAPLALSASPLPAGVTFVDSGSGRGTLQGTAAVAPGSYAVTITASNGVGTAASQPFTLVVTQAPAITSASKVTVTHGTTMSAFTVRTTGWPVPGLTVTGTKPSGVTFADDGNGTATISGAVGSAKKTYTLTIKATNSISFATQTFSLTVR